MSVFDDLRAVETKLKGMRLGHPLYSKLRRMKKALQEKRKAHFKRYY